MNGLIIVRQGPSLLGLLLVVGFLIAFWEWFLVVIVIAVALALGWYIYKAREADNERMMRQWHAEQEHRQELRARADIENALWHAGDPRGTYGLDFHGKESRS